MSIDHDYEIARGDVEGGLLPPQRTIAELRAEILARTETKTYPLRDLELDDVRAALANLTDAQPDTWAAAWSPVAERHAAAGDWWRAYLSYDFGRWPARTSAGKRRAYENGIGAFRTWAATLPAPPEIVRIPFEGGEIAGYVRVPPAIDGPVPIALTIGAIDEWKEKNMLRWAPLLDHGIATFSVDMPGTGEAPILVEPHAERMFSAILDWIVADARFDHGRIAALGISWSSHWSAKLSYLERERLCCAVVQGGQCDGFFSREWQSKMLGTREYLFDLFAARSTVYGVSTVEAFLDFGPRMSLVEQHVIGEASCPTLLVNGYRDTQVPIEDLLLQQRTGSPKSAWINPAGFHMGTSPDWPEPRIKREIVVPYVVRAMKGTLNARAL
jgi:esterase FrsA